MGFNKNVKYLIIILIILILGCVNEKVTLSNLKVFPEQARIGEPVKVSVMIKGAGIHNISLFLDDNLLETKRVSLKPKESRIIDFIINSSQGNHTVRIMNLTKEFSVRPLIENKTNLMKKETPLITNFSTLTYFPVSLDSLKSKIDRDKLKEYTMSGTVSLISPFMYHFGVSHVEGTGKLYIYSPDNTNLLIISPADALINKNSMNELINKKTEFINNTEVYPDFDNLILMLDKQKHIRLGHVWILKSLVNKVLNSTNDYYFIKAGTPIGYNNKDWAFDYYFYDELIDNGPSHLKHYACPIKYYNKTMQEEINQFYDEYVYNDMKLSGKWPESRLCGEVNININNSIWGEWYYKTGYRVINSNSRWYQFKNGLLLFFNKKFVNNETFNKLWDGQLITEECPDWEGFYLGLEDDFTDGKNFIGACVIKTSNDHILMLKQFGNNSNVIKYFKFSLTGNEMTGELFNNFSEANKGFVKPTTYTKIEREANPLIS